MGNVATEVDNTAGIVQRPEDRRNAAIRPIWCIGNGPPDRVGNPVTVFWGP